MPNAAAREWRTGEVRIPREPAEAIAARQRRSHPAGPLCTALCPPSASVREKPRLTLSVGVLAMIFGDVNRARAA